MWSFFLFPLYFEVSEAMSRLRRNVTYKFIVLYQYNCHITSFSCLLYELIMWSFIGKPHAKKDQDRGGRCAGCAHRPEHQGREDPPWHDPKPARRAARY